MKKTFAALSLATVMLFGSTLSFAGIIISDKAEPKQCSADKDGIIISDIAGIIISDLAFGPGIIIFDKADACATPDKGGIIISD